MLWTFSESREITYYIINVNSGRCMRKAGLQRYPEQSGCVNFQDWHISPVGTVKFRAQHSLKCLDVDNSGGATVSGAVAQQWTCLGAEARNQQFLLVLVSLPEWSETGSDPSSGSGFVYPALYRLVPVHSKMCLAHNNQFANGTRVRQRTCGSQPDLWSLYPIDLSSGRQIFKIRQQTTNGGDRGTCVDVDNAVPGRSNQPALGPVPGHSGLTAPG